MGIESLNSAAAAAGFAMVSDDVGDESSITCGWSSSDPADPASLPAPSLLPAIVDTAGRGAANSAAALGARVTGLLDSWRSRG